jgi:flagellin
MLQRIRELAVQAKSGTNGAPDIARLQQEADALFTEISRVSDQTMYNNKAYLGKDAGTVKVQVGYNDGETIALLTRDISADVLGTVTSSSGAAVTAVNNVAIASGTAAHESANGNRLHTVTDATDAVTGSQQVEDTGAVTFAEDEVITITDGAKTATHTVVAGSVSAADVAAALQTSANTQGASFSVAANAGGDGVTITYSGNGPQSTTMQVDGAALSLTTTTAGVADVAAVPASSIFLNIAGTTALQVISDAIDQVAGYKADWGAGQNRLEYTVSNLMNVVEFTSAARSRIQDADFAVEAANLAKAQVLQQTGTAMLAQANAAPQLALQLLK